MRCCAVGAEGITNCHDYDWFGWVEIPILGASSAIKPGTKMSISLIENVEGCEMKIDVNKSLIGRNSAA